MNQLSNKVHLTECPRDAMQGISEWIPTEKKIAYLKTLLKVGFDTLDFGSFVSPKAIPQMRDTADVLAGIENESSQNTKLLAIVANEKGAEQAASFDRIDYLGYPFSISETFQQRNTNAGIEASFSKLKAINEISVKADKKLVVYISMAFGNPYGDIYHPELVCEWISKLSAEVSMAQVALSDTIGNADSKGISDLFQTVIPSFPNLIIGAHLHAREEEVANKAKMAYLAGCRYFDGAILGYGGCPMAKDDLLGNMNTELMVSWFLSEGIEFNINPDRLRESALFAREVFP